MPTDGLPQSISPEFRLLDILHRDRESYKELHNTLFKNTAMSSQWLDWYHGKIGSLQGETRTYGVVDGKKLIGIWSLEPKTLNVSRTDKIPVGRCFSVGIHPDYRRYGLFVQLSKFAIAQERERCEYEHVIGFPQIGRPVIGGHLKAGWELVQEIPMYGFNPEHLKEPVPLSEVKVLSSFQNLEAFPSNCGSLETTHAYRKLRWLEHPDNHYICLGRGRSYVVLKPYDNLCHLLDLQGDDEDLVVLLKASQTLARRHRWREINLWCAENDVYRATIEKAGFQGGSELSLPVVLLSVRIRSETRLTLKQGSNFQLGVEEIY